MSDSDRQKLERVPRADRLDVLRDILNLLTDLGGVSGKKRLLYETRENTATEPYFSDTTTFGDYLTSGQMLTLLEIRNNVVVITEKGSAFVKVGKFGETNLSKVEQSFLRPLCLEYQPFRTFIILGFCKGLDSSSLHQIYIDSECPKRKELLENYMQVKGHDSDREARTLLSWSQQIGLVEFDEYSLQYYLVREHPLDLDLFLRELSRTYLEIHDPRQRVALIPELRARFCCKMNVNRKVFDESVLELNRLMPSKVQLGKATSSREDVRKLGIHGKTFYYYYIKVIGGSASL